MLIGSPMCTAFCTWMALNEARSSDKAAIAEAKRKAIVHIAFVLSLYRAQLDGGRYVLHEHPIHATSWQLGAVQELMAAPSVQRAQGD